MYTHICHITTRVKRSNKKNVYTDIVLLEKKEKEKRNYKLTVQQKISRGKNSRHTDCARRKHLKCLKLLCEKHEVRREVALMVKLGRPFATSITVRGGIPG